MRPLSCVVVMLCGAFCLSWSGCNKKVEPSTNENLKNNQGTKTDSFFLALSVKPKKLANNTLFNLSPIEAFVRESLPIGTLSTKPIDELVVYAGVKTKDSDQADKWKTQELVELLDRLNLGATAKLDRPLSMDELIKEWRGTKSPDFYDAPAIQPIETGKEGYFKVPNGTFLKPRRQYANKLEFLDRRGAPANRGVDVGNFSSKAYILGGSSSLARAIFTFDNVDQSMIHDGHLELDVRFHSVTTWFTGDDEALGAVVLETKHFSTDPQFFAFESFKNKRIQIPEMLQGVKRTYQDGEVVGENSTKIDLAKELLADGPLKIRFRCGISGTFLGLDRYDVNISTRTYEYAYLQGQRFAVAQSVPVLNQLIAEFETGIHPQRDSLLTNDFGFQVEPQSNLHNVFLQKMIAYAKANFDFQLKHQKSTDPMTNFRQSLLQEVESLAENLKQLSVALNFDGSASKITVHHHAQITAVEQKQKLLDIYQLMGESIYDQWKELFERDSYGVLIGLSFFLDLSFPDSDANPKDRDQKLRKIASEWVTDTQLEVSEGKIDVRFKLPQFESENSPLKKDLLARWESKRAAGFRIRHRFAMADEAFQRGALAISDPIYFRARQGYQCIFNTSREFTSFKDKYQWIRYGIEVLLEGAEQNDRAPELVFLAGYWLAYKIGTADERVDFDKLIASDVELHQRIGRFIDLEKTKGQGDKPKSWLIAQQLALYATEKIETTDQMVSSKFFIGLPIFTTLPAICQVNYAQSLDDAGDFEAAKNAWQAAEEKYRLLLKRFRPLDEKLKAELPICEFAFLDYWLNRSIQEQADDVRQARELSFRAKALLEKEEYAQARELYSQAIQLLLTEVERSPKKMNVLLHDFADEWRNYERCCSGADQRIEEKLIEFIGLPGKSAAELKDSYHKINVIYGPLDALLKIRSR